MAGDGPCMLSTGCLAHASRSPAVTTVLFHMEGVSRLHRQHTDFGYGGFQF